MDTRFAHRRPRRAFTLVELLVVIVIIGILTGLVTGAAIMARNAARRTAIVTEIHDMELALGAYKEKMGDYPPDFGEPQDPNYRDPNTQPPKPRPNHPRDSAVTRHLARAFPRYTASLPDNDTNNPGFYNSYAVYHYEYIWQRHLYVYLRVLLNSRGVPNPDNLADQFVQNLNPSVAMAFWLGGLPDENLNPNGFSANPSNPFDITTSRIGPFFELNRTRLHKPSDSDINPSSLLGPPPPSGVGPTPQERAAFVSTCFFRFFPNNANGESEPYVYFRPKYWTTQANPAFAVVTMSHQLTGRALQQPRPFTKFWFSPLTGTQVRPYWDAEQLSAIDARFGGNTNAELAYLQGAANVDLLWPNPKLFQILCPGLDGKYGHGAAGNNNDSPGNSFPTGADYVAEQFDDLTNFSGGTLKDKMP